MTEAGAWIGRDAVRTAGRAAAPAVLRLDRALLDWLRSVAGLPVRPDAPATATDARAQRVRLAALARERGYVEGDPPRLVPELVPVLLSLAAPSLVVTAVQSAFGAVGRFEVRVGEIPVVVHGGDPDGERDYEPRPDLDLVDALLTRLDLPAAPLLDPVRVGPFDPPDPDRPTPAPDPTDAGDQAGPTGADSPAGGSGTADAGMWTGVLAADVWRSLGAAEDPEAAAAAAGCPVELARAAAEPVATGRVEVVSRAGAGLATGPTAVGVTELAWIDGGAHGLWRVRTAELDLGGEPLAVELRRASPGALAQDLARAVRAAEGC